MFAGNNGLKTPALQVLQPSARSARSVTAASDEQLQVRDTSQLSSVSQNGRAVSQTSSKTIRPAQHLKNIDRSDKYGQTARCSLNGSVTEQTPWESTQPMHRAKGMYAEETDTVLTLYHDAGTYKNGKGKDALKVSLNIVGGSGNLAKRMHKMWRRTLAKMRKRMWGRRKQIVVGVLFLLCVGVIYSLMAADDEDVLPVAEKYGMDDVMLPNVRVNPLLLADLKDGNDVGLHQ